jgi:hypothetical protein
MPRWHEDHQPVDVAALNRFQSVSDQAVVVGDLVLRVGVASEAEQAFP